jgi:hypothetical protein
LTTNHYLLKCNCYTLQSSTRIESAIELAGSAGKAASLDSGCGKSNPMMFWEQTMIATPKFARIVLNETSPMQVAALDSGGRRPNRSIDQ